MKAKKKEILIGLTVLVTIVLFFWGTNFIQGKNLFSKGSYYYVVYENSKGLSTSHKVELNGFAIGKVDEIGLHPDNSGRILVKLYIGEDIMIPEGAKAEVIAGMLGSTIVELHIPEYSESYLEEDDTLEAYTSMGVFDLIASDELGSITSNAQNIMKTLDTLLISIQEILNDESVENLKSSFSHLDGVLNNLSTTTANLDGIVSSQQNSLESMIYNLNVISVTLGDKSGEIDRAIDNFATFSDSLNTLNIAELNNAVHEVNLTIEAINTKQGTLGELVYDKTLYENLEKTTEELNVLIEDIKVNPSKYVNITVFGKKDKDKKEQ